MEETQQAGFILFGGFRAARLFPSFLTALKAHKLRILVIDAPDPTADGLLCMRDRDQTHPFWQMDEIFFAESADHDSIMNRVSSWAQRYQVRGVCCIREILVEPAGLAADYLGLPSPGLRATKVCRNKHLQRLYLREWSPAFTVVSPTQRDEVVKSFTSFPAVLKPSGRHSSSGVQLINDRETLSSCLQQYSPHEVLLLEARIVGREVSVETLVQQGQVIFENVTQKRTNETESRFFVEMAHTIPSTNLTQEEKEHLLTVNRAVLKRLAFQDGIAHGEYRVTDEGQVYIMEIAARNPGDGILPLYHLATGEAMEPVLIKIALGEPVSYPAPVRYARQVYLNHSYGHLQDVIVNGDDNVEPIWIQDQGFRQALTPGAMDDSASLREIMVLKKRGNLLVEIADSFDRCVTALMDAATLKELDVLEDELCQRITILSESAD